MSFLETISSTHSLHMWLGIPIIIRLFLDEYDPSGRVFFTPESRSVCCGVIVACIIVSWFRNPARRLVLEDEDDDELGIKKSSFFSSLATSAFNTISSSSSSMFRNALFVSILFWFSWPSGKQHMYAVAGSDGNRVCDADDLSPTCRLQNHYGPPICCVAPSYCDIKAHNWIYEQGGTAQAYKPNVPSSQTICDPTEIREQNMRHKVATWPYWRSSRKSPPELKIRLNLMVCTDGSSLIQETDETPAESETRETEESDHRHLQEEGSSAHDSSCCCHPLLSKESENATIEVWQAKPDGTYSSLRPGNNDGECRAKWVIGGASNPEDQAMTMVEFSTVAPGSTGSMGGLGPGGWEFSPYGPPVVHILVTPGVDGVRPLLVDVPVPMAAKSLEKKPFTWTDWRGPAWVKSKGKLERSSFNITSWNTDTEENTVSVDVDLFLQEDKEFSVSYMASKKKLMCPSLFYGLPRSFYLEPISLCGRYLLDYFDL